MDLKQKVEELENDSSEDVRDVASNALGMIRTINEAVDDLKANYKSLENKLSNLEDRKAEVDEGLGEFAKVRLALDTITYKFEQGNLRVVERFENWLNENKY